MFQLGAKFGSGFVALKSRATNSGAGESKTAAHAMLRPGVLDTGGTFICTR